MFHHARTADMLLLDLNHERSALEDTGCQHDKHFLAHVADISWPDRVPHAWYASQHCGGPSPRVCACFSLLQLL